MDKIKVWHRYKKFISSGIVISPEEMAYIDGDVLLNNISFFDRNKELCELCINCNQPQGSHYGGKCPLKSTIKASGNVWVTKDMFEAFEK